jgi:hypothetical protein
MKQNKFSLVIDSSFRTKKLYPLSTKFEVPVNSIVTNEYLETPLKGFTWGKDSFEIIGTIAGGNQENLILSPEFLSPFPNHYIGCLLVLYNSSLIPIESSYIVDYNPDDNTVSLQYPLTTSISINNVIHIVYPDSSKNPYTIQILGYESKEIFEYDNIYIYNYSQKWIREIKTITSLGLATLKEPIPIDKYLPEDKYEIRTSRQMYQYSLDVYYMSITKYEIINGSHNYEIGSYVYIEPDVGGVRQIFRVKDKNVFEIVEYGGPFKLQASHLIYPFDYNNVSSTELSILVSLQTSFVINAGTNSIPDPTTHILNFDGATVVGSLIFFNYRVDKNYIITLDSLLDNRDDIPKFENNEWTGYNFIPREIVTCSMNVANWSFPQNPLCLTVCIDTLILPNLPVKNYNKLLSFFPYVIVRIYNTDASQFSRYGTITSNNPNSSNAQFICPIGNLQNPDIIRFVEISSETVQSLKFDPTQNIYFEVLLPDGNVLEYEDTQTRISIVRPFFESLAIYQFTITDTVACLLSLTVEQ